MILLEMLRDERAEGKAEGITEGFLRGKVEDVMLLLEELGPITKDIQVKVKNEKDVSVLDKWLKLAAKAETIEQFREAM